MKPNCTNCERDHLGRRCPVNPNNESLKKQEKESKKRIRWSNVTEKEDDKEREQRR